MSGGKATLLLHHWPVNSVIEREVWLEMPLIEVLKSDHSRSSELKQIGVCYCHTQAIISNFPSLYVAEGYSS